MVLRFTYSYPYELAWLKLSSQRITNRQNLDGQKITQLVQTLWRRYEKNVLNLFRLIYKIKISEEVIKVYISLVAPNSFSDPLTISLKNFVDLESNQRSQRGVIYSILHELAHYFAYTRGKESYFNKLHSKIQKLDLLGEQGANLHYLIQAVEFGIIGEIFGENYAIYRREWIVKNWGNNKYGKSAKLLKEHNIPLNRACLESIEKRL